MTKLEEKVIELGYKRADYKEYFKKTKGKFVYIFVYLDETKTKINNYGIQTPNNIFRKQSQIEYLQQAFNEMQKDLEELRKYEEV